MDRKWFSFFYIFIYLFITYLRKNRIVRIQTFSFLVCLSFALHAWRIKVEANVAHLHLVCPWCFHWTVDIRQTSRRALLPAALMTHVCGEARKPQEWKTKNKKQNNTTCPTQTRFLCLCLDDANETHCTCGGCHPTTDSEHRLEVWTAAKARGSGFAVFSALWNVLWQQANMHFLVCFSGFFFVRCECQHFVLWADIRRERRSINQGQVNYWVKAQPCFHFFFTTIVCASDCWKGGVVPNFLPGFPNHVVLFMLIRNRQCYSTSFFISNFFSCFLWIS